MLDQLMRNTKATLRCEAQQAVFDIYGADIACVKDLAPEFATAALQLTADPVGFLRRRSHASFLFSAVVWEILEHELFIPGLQNQVSLLKHESESCE